MEYNISTGQELSLHPDFLDEAKGCLGWHSSYLEEIPSGDLLLGRGDSLSPDKSLVCTFPSQIIAAKILLAQQVSKDKYTGLQIQLKGTCILVRHPLTQSHSTISLLPQLKC